MELRKHHLTASAGFTLMEVLVAISILGLIAGIGLAGYLGAHRRAILTSQVQIFSDGIREAQGKAQTAVKGRPWGVQCTPDGSAWEQFSVKPGGTDIEVHRDFSNGVACAASPEVRFAKLTGQPDHETSFVLTFDTLSKTVHVPVSGAVSVL